jgi:2,3-bisphosphoglycerate-independent phosphoglycerate mutase
MNMNQKKPTVLLVLDGWGHAAATDWNAITQAPAANFLEWWQVWPHALLSASGKEVGLPLGLMGNSEVGHTNIGAGRVVYQTITKIDKSIRTGEFQRVSALRNAIDHARMNDTQLHFFGLLGNGGVHASNGHYRELLKLARDMGMDMSKVCFHALMDGRDTPPTSGGKYLRELQAMLDEFGGRIATICGRYFAMDRDTRWDRTELFWNALIHDVGVRGDGSGDGVSADARNNPQAAYKAALARGERDEFIKPILLGEPGSGRVCDGDAVISFNFRADRVRQITEALLADEFSAFERGKVPKVHYATMTQYRKDFACPVAYPPDQLHSLFGELVAARGMTQFRCAETEKYAHVTFFFNGGREEVYAGEDRVLIPSPGVATYDLQPEMSAPAVCDAVVENLRRGQHDLYVVNFANADMVGHTGIVGAAEAAVRAVDVCLKRIVDETLRQGGSVAITADHGNSEMMVDPVSGEAHTAHTVNPVPFLLIGDAFRGTKLREVGILADVAPTLMQAMNVDQPDVMDGHSLLLP